MTTPPSTAPRTYPGPTRSGAVTFAGVILLIAASFNLLDGVVAIAEDDHFRSDELIFGDLSAWGIWWLVVGALQLYAGWQVMKRTEAGMIMGIALAGLNAFSQLLFLGVYPAWSIAIMVLDILVVWALTMNIDEFE